MKLDEQSKEGIHGKAIFGTLHGHSHQLLLLIWFGLAASSFC